MNRLAVSLAIACAAALFATTANAETVEDLKRDLAAKKAYIAKLERRLRDLEKRPAAVRPTLVTAPVAPPPSRVAVAAAPPPSPEDEEMERALERTLVREGALVLPPWTFELTPQFSYAHWESVRIHLSAIPTAPGSRCAWACLGHRRSLSHCPMYGTSEGTHFRLPLALATQASSFPKNC